MKKDQLLLGKLLPVAIAILASLTTQTFGQTTPARNQSLSQSAKRAGEIFALSELTDTASLEKLRRSLADPDWYVRGEAARAIGLRGDKSSSSALLALTEDQ